MIFYFFKLRPILSKCSHQVSFSDGLLGPAACSHLSPHNSDDIKNGGKLPTLSCRYCCLWAVSPANSHASQLTHCAHSQYVPTDSIHLQSDVTTTLRGGLLPLFAPACAHSLAAKLTQGSCRGDLPPSDAPLIDSCLSLEEKPVASFASLLPHGN